MTSRIGIALLVVVLVVASVSANSSFLGRSNNKPTFVGVKSRVLPPSIEHVKVIRGGEAAAAAAAAAVEDEIEIESSDEEVDESEEEEEEEDEVELDPKLAKATQQKAATIKTKMVKESIAEAVASKPQTKTATKKKSSSSLLKMFYIPYIIKACLNPFTFIQMTKAYWSSLIRLDYLESKKDTSQDLRSALQDKAKKSGGSSSSTSSRGKRKFKPGQAKVRSVQK